METTIRAYRRLIQQIEVKAAAKVESVYTSPTVLRSENVSEKMLSIIKPEREQSTAEGAKFGEFIYNFAIELRKKRGKNESSPRGTSDKKKVKVISIKGEKELLNLELENHRKTFLNDIEVKARKLRLRGMSNKQVELYFKSDAFLITWQGFRNRIKKSMSSHIIAVSNCGYMIGLGVKK